MDCCDVFISCLDSHSDGTHSLQRIHWWASHVMLHFSKSDEEKNSSRMTWGWVHVQLILFFCWIISLIVTQHFCVAQNSVKQMICRHAVCCCLHQQIYTEQSEHMLQSRFKLQVTPRSSAQKNTLYRLLHHRLLSRVFPEHRADCDLPFWGLKCYC